MCQLCYTGRSCSYLKKPYRHIFLASFIQGYIIIKPSLELLLNFSAAEVMFGIPTSQMAPLRDGDEAVKFSTKSSASSPAQSYRCEKRPRPGVVGDADVLSGGSVLGQSVFRSRRAILRQVICVRAGLRAANHVCSTLRSHKCLSLLPFASCCVSRRLFTSCP